MRGAFSFYSENASNNKRVTICDHNNGGYMNNNIKKGKDLFPFRIVSETPTGDGFVDCVWEMPVWVVEKLEAEAKKREITVSELVTLIFKACLKEYGNKNI